MTPPSLPTPKRPASRPRRVKRGVIAGYIHDISARHRPASTPVPTIRPATATAAPTAG